MSSFCPNCKKVFKDNDWKHLNNSYVCSECYNNTEHTIPTIAGPAKVLPNGLNYLDVSVYVNVGDVIPSPATAVFCFSRQDDQSPFVFNHVYISPDKYAIPQDYKLQLLESVQVSLKKWLEYGFKHLLDAQINYLEHEVRVREVSLAHLNANIAAYNEVITDCQMKVEDANQDVRRIIDEISKLKISLQTFYQASMDSPK